MFIVVQPTLRQPTKLPYTLILGKKQTNTIKPKYEHTQLESTSNDSKGGIDQQDNVQPSSSTCTVESQLTEKKDGTVLTEGDKTSTAEKQSKHEISVSYLQPELSTKGSDAIHSDSPLSQCSTQPGATSSDVKEQCMSKSKHSIVDISVEEIHHHEGASNSKFKSEVQNSSTMFRESHSNATNTSVVMKDTSIMKPSPEEHKGHHDTELVDNNSTVSSLSASYSSQSSSIIEPSSHDEVSCEEAEGNVMFEELFGSSGEDENLKEDDSVVGWAANDDSDEMELGTAHHEIEQRKVEEEFKRIITHSADVPNTSVSNMHKIVNNVSALNREGNICHVFK